MSGEGRTARVTPAAGSRYVARGAAPDAIAGEDRPFRPPVD